MPLNKQPPFTHLAAYRPITFEAIVPIPIAQSVENALVNIFKDGLPILDSPAVYKSSGNAPNINPAFQDYYFDIDIAKYVQDSLGPTTDFPSTMPSKTVVTADNSEFYGEYYIEVTYQYIDIFGLLDDLAFADASNTYTVFAASKENQEPMFMEDYLGTSPVTADRPFLTKSARTLPVCVSDNAFLSVIQAQNAFPTDAFEARFYDSSGVLIESAFGSLNVLVAASMKTLNTGLEALQNAAWLTGPPTLPNTNIKSYTVQFGDYNFPVFTPQTEIFTYNVIGECCGLRELRLHWVNLLGGTDSYTFNSEKDLRIETTSDTGKKALKWKIGDTDPHDPSDVGKFKTRSKAVKSYNLKSKIMSNDEALWLSGILYSPKVYADINGQFIAVEVKPTNQSISRHTGKIPFEITVELSQDLIIPRI
jgi:hypothetical protein